MKLEDICVVQDPVNQHKCIMYKEDFPDEATQGYVILERKNYSSTDWTTILGNMLEDNNHSTWFADNLSLAIESCTMPEDMAAMFMQSLVEAYDKEWN